MLKAEQMYPSDLTDRQWQIIHNQIPEARRGGRPRTTNVREILNGILYLIQTGCAWRYLPKNYPKWQTVYGYFALWRSQGVLKQIHDCLVVMVREDQHRNPKTSVLIVDSQSIRAPRGENRGYDGFKKVRGRKRNIMVDSQGLIHSVYVASAQRSDASMAKEMLDPDGGHFPSGIANKLNAFYADGAYLAHGFQNDVHKNFDLWPTFRRGETKNICRYNADKDKYYYERVVTKSNLKPVRWIVERTIAWFSNYRRLSRDYEKITSNSEAMIHVSMTLLMLRKLDRAKPYQRWKS